MNLSQLNGALESHGWFAEWLSADDTDCRLMLARPQGGQLHNRFEFDPSDPEDNRPWDNEGAVHGFTRVLDDKAVENALFALCKEAQMSIDHDES